MGAQRLGHGFDLLPAVLAQWNVQRALDATLFVVLGCTRVYEQQAFHVLSFRFRHA